MFWGCCTFNGTGRLCPIEEMMNLVKYREILATKLVTSMQKSFPDDGGIFQQDNASCHSSKKKKKKNAKVFQKRQIDRSTLSCKLPRLKLQSKICGQSLKKRFQKCDCFTKTKLNEVIIGIWYHDDEVQYLLEPCWFYANTSFYDHQCQRRAY